jgi:hypothetical protein
MATSPIDLKQRLFADLRNNSALLALLGPISADNHRIYSGWPQIQPRLTGHEPAEGWVVFYELTTTQPVPTQLYKDSVYQVNVWSTRQTLGDQCVALMEAMWDTAGVDQNGWAITGDWIVLAGQLILSQDLYEDAIKCYRKLTNWHLRHAKIPYRLGA